LYLLREAPEECIFLLIFRLLFLWSGLLLGELARELVPHLLLGFFLETRVVQRVLLFTGPADDRIGLSLFLLTPSGS
jgi:hypothetical protein